MSFPQHELPGPAVPPPVTVLPGALRHLRAQRPNTAVVTAPLQSPASGNAETLPPDESAIAAGLPELARQAFTAGRVALRAAVRLVGYEHGAFAIGRSGRGAPLLPPGMSGSISHKRSIAIAAATRATASEHLGIDVEDRAKPGDETRPSIASRILTAREQEAIDDLRQHDPLAYRDAVLLRFSLKEAVYKAIDPLVHRYVRFSEVEVDVTPDGRATVTLLLPEASLRDVHVHAEWQWHEAYIISAAFSESR